MIIVSHYSLCAAALTDRATSHLRGGMTTTDMAESARRAATLAAADFDASRCASAVGDLDLHGLQAMARVLSQATPDNGVPTEPGLAARLKAAPRHRWLLRRWLTELRERRWLASRPGSHWAFYVEERPERRDLRDVCRDLGFSTELGQFFERCNRQLPGLLQDRVLPQELLFPGGDIVTAEAAYRTGAIDRYLNAAAREVVSWAARQLPSPVRILELGAGAGGTTAEIVPALAGMNVDYHFTDVSQFFLASAQRRFASYPWMRYGIVDLNADLERQPSAGIVLAANVLHNAHHSGKTLRRLYDIVTPGGVLVFIESCREHCQFLTSMHFLMSPLPGQCRPGHDDVRADTGRIFLRGREWLRELRGAGFEPLLVLPEPGNKLSVLGQRVFAARKTG